MARKKSAVEGVESFMQQLEHPFKAGIELLRSAIKSVDGKIQEEVKWNAPSFKLEDLFATFKLHPAKNIQLVLHRGAKPKAILVPIQMSDPHHLLKWAAEDRCVITLNSNEQARELEVAVKDLIRQWIKQIT